MEESRGFQDFLENLNDSFVGDIPGVGLATNEITDFVGDTTDFFNNPSAGDFFETLTPGVVEDVVDGGGLTDLGGVLPGPINDVVNGGGYDLPFGIGPTLGPNAPSAAACPVGYMPNPELNNPQLRSATPGARTTPIPNCIPNPAASSNPQSTGSAPASAPVPPGMGCDPCYWGCLPATVEKCTEAKATLTEMEGWLNAKGLDLNQLHDQRCSINMEYDKLQCEWDTVREKYIERTMDFLDNCAGERAQCCPIPPEGLPCTGCPCSTGTRNGCGCGCSATWPPTCPTTMDYCAPECGVGCNPCATGCSKPCGTAPCATSGCAPMDWSRTTPCAKPKVKKAACKKRKSVYSTQTSRKKKTPVCKKRKGAGTPASRKKQKCS